MSNQARKSFQQIWKFMDAGRRRQAAEVFFTTGASAGEQRVASSLIAGRLHLRPQTAAKLPPEKLASYLSSIQSIDDLLAGAVIRSYLFTSHEPMLAMFLDELQIQHNKGVISAENVTPPSADALRTATERIRSAFAAEDVELYLAALAASDPLTWANLNETAPQQQV